MNALRYGAPNRPVRIVLSGLESEVALRVENEGSKIPSVALSTLFDPLVRGAGNCFNGMGMGLGLYICREIATAHGGLIKAHSTDAETVFTVRLPREGYRLTA